MVVDFREAATLRSCSNFQVPKYAHRAPVLP
jgi:hypothetical protein